MVRILALLLFYAWAEPDYNVVGNTISVSRTRRLRSSTIYCCNAEP